MPPEDAQAAYEGFAGAMGSWMSPWAELTDGTRFAWRAAVAALDLARSKRSNERAERPGRE